MSVWDSGALQAHEQCKDLVGKVQGAFLHYADIQGDVKDVKWGEGGEPIEYKFDQVVVNAPFNESYSPAVPTPQDELILIIQPPEPCDDGQKVPLPLYHPDVRKKWGPVSPGVLVLGNTLLQQIADGKYIKK